MKRLSQLLVMAGVAVALALSTSQANAQGRQGRGNMTPEEMRTRMMERYKEALAPGSDAEWKILETRLGKVMEARRDVGFGGGRGFGRPPGGGPGGPGGQDREANPEAEALQKAIDAKAPADEIKTKLAAFREARQRKQAALDAARAELKKVCSMRQEAICVRDGILE